MPKLRVLREYEVDVPIPGSPEWHKLVACLRDADFLEEFPKEVNLEVVAILLTYQADMGNEQFPHADERKLAEAALVDETVYDPQHYTNELAPTGK
jgi:hypothetical protein